MNRLSTMSSHTKAQKTTYAAKYVMSGLSSSCPFNYSYDGSIWYNGSGLNSLCDAQSIVWNGSIWLAGGTSLNSNTYHVFTSTDGKSWSVVPNSNIFSGNVVKCIAWNGSMFVLVGTGTNQIYYSSGGSTFSQASTGSTLFNSSSTSSSASCYHVAWYSALSLWVCCGVPIPAMANNTLGWSSDGLNWTLSTSGGNCFSNKGANCSAYSPTLALLVAGGYGTNYFSWSTDGKNWTSSTSTGSCFSSSYCWSIAWNSTLSLFIAGGQGTNQLAWSTDGKSWSSAVSGGNCFVPQKCDAVYCSPDSNLCFAVGSSTTGKIISTSTDGKNWTQINLSALPIAEAECISSRTINLFPTTSGLFSTKWINFYYTGPIIQFYHNVTTLTQDFYIDSTGYVMTTQPNGAGTSFNTWLNGGTCNVVYWYDQSGYGNHAKQLTTTQQPIYDSTTRMIDFNGYKFFYFDVNPIPYTGSYTVSVKHGTIANPSTTGTILSCGNTLTTNQCNMFSISSSSTYVNSWKNNNFTSNTNLYNANGNIVTWQYDSTSTTTNIYINGSFTNSGSTNRTSWACTNNNAYFGKSYLGSDYFNGQLESIYLFNSVISSSDRTNYGI